MVRSTMGCQFLRVSQQALILAPLRFDVFVSELNDRNWFAEDSERGEWLVHWKVGDAIQRHLGRLEKWSERY